MKTFLLTVALAALAVPLLTACADPSRATDAEALRREIADLPGVADVNLKYAKPLTLDSGKLELRVDMAADADPADAVDVVVKAYEGFAGTHRGEEGDIYVAVGDDTIHLRSFEPDAKAAAVEQATTHAITVLSSGAVVVDIDTQDAKKSPYVFTAYDVTIAGQGADDVLRALTDLEKVHGDIPDAGWSVQTRGSSGWQLRSLHGFPDSEQRALFNRLRADLPKGALVFLTDKYVNVQVPTGTTPDEVSAMVGHHLALLGGATKAFYDVTTDEDFYVMITLGDCTFAPGEIGALLKRDHGASCTKFTKAAP